MSQFSINQSAKVFSNPFRDLEVEWEGDWIKYQRLMNYLSAKGNSGIKRSIVRGQRSYLEKFKSTLIKGFLSQGQHVGSPWAPRQSNRTNVLGQRTKALLFAMMGLKITQRNYNLFLAFPSGALQTKSGGKPGSFTMARYAAAFEYGTSRQPARPTWYPTFTTLGGRNGAKAHLVSSIKNDLGNIGVR